MHHFQTQMAHKLKKRLESVPFKHNSSFLKDVPKSDFYQVCEKRQEGLVKASKWRTHADVK